DGIRDYKVTGVQTCALPISATKPRHSTAPLGLPGSAITSAPSTIAAKLRERMELGVNFIDSARMTSPNPGTSRRMIARIASGVKIGRASCRERVEASEDGRP